MIILKYFSIAHATNKDGSIMTKDEIMEEYNFWSIGTKGIEHWGIPLERLFNKFYT